MNLINLLLLCYTKSLPTISSKYLVFHQQWFHMHLLSFQLLLFLLMSSLVLLHFVLTFLRTLKCQTTKSISYAKLSRKFQIVLNLSSSVWKFRKTWYLHMLVRIPQKEKNVVFTEPVLNFCRHAVTFVMPWRWPELVKQRLGIFVRPGNIAADRLKKCGIIDQSKDDWWIRLETIARLPL